MERLTQPVRGDSWIRDHMFRFLVHACKVRELFPTRPSFLTPMANSGVSTATLKFNNSVEGLFELAESYYNHCYGLLQQKDTE